MASIPDVQLRDVAAGDVGVFFEQQRDPLAHRMVAFTARDPEDRPAFTAHWARILADAASAKKTVLFEGRVAGYLVCFERGGRPEVGNWIGRELWGRGVASRALAQFLGEIPTRPLWASVAGDNAASIRVLEKCGFEVQGSERSFAQARGEEIEEVILKLEGAPDARPVR